MVNSLWNEIQLYAAMCQIMYTICMLQFIIIITVILVCNIKFVLCK